MTLNLSRFIALLTLTASLTGCVFVAGAAAGAAAIGVVYDHRNIQSSVEDTKVAERVSENFATVPGLASSHIDVTAFNGTVLLAGETDSPDLRKQAGIAAQNTPGVSRVYNEITIEGNISPLTRTSDSWITTKIKGTMLATEDLKSSSIKVVTENGSVYLMGIVTRAQADIAVDIARHVSGVQRVVKIFQYRNE